MTTALIIGCIILFVLGCRIFSNLGTYTGWLETKYVPPDEELDKAIQESNLTGCVLLVLGLGAVVFAIYALNT